jgi:hypothetical protein
MHKLNLSPEHACACGPTTGCAWRGRKWWIVENGERRTETVRACAFHVAKWKRYLSGTTYSLKPY